jgi:hypothetical protein
MIELFAYKNREGKKSIKIIGTTGQRFDENEKRTYFSGISLGKVFFNSPFSLADVLEDLTKTQPLDHMPRRGEGLPEYNSCYKMFDTDRVYCWLGQLDPSKISAEELEKTIKFLKGLTEEEQDELADKVSETDYTDPAALAILPVQIVGILASASNDSEVRSTASKSLDSYFGIGFVSGTSRKSTGGYNSATSSSETEVIKNLRALARSLGYDIVKL